MIIILHTSIKVSNRYCNLVFIHISRYVPLKFYMILNSFWWTLKAFMNVGICCRRNYDIIINAKLIIHKYVLFGKFNQVKNDRQSFDAKPNSCKWELLYCNPNCLKARNSKPSLHNVCTFNTALKMHIKRYWLHQMIVFIQSLNRINGLIISKFKEN